MICINIDIERPDYNQTWKGFQSVVQLSDLLIRYDSYHMSHLRKTSLKTYLMIETINTRTAKTCFFGGASSNVIGPTVIVPSSTSEDRRNLDKTWFLVSLNTLVLKSRVPPSLDIEQVTWNRDNRVWNNSK